MLKRIFFLLCFFMMSQAPAAPTEGFDYRLEPGAQTFPAGGMLTGKGGYGHKLWEGPAAEGTEPQWLYGYIRPNIEINTAAIVNRATLAVDLYPVSIFGVTAGVGSAQRNMNDFSDFDCKAIQCDHSLDFQFVQARFIAGYEKIAAVLTARYDHYHSSLNRQPFYEEMSYLVGQAENDDLKTLNVLLNYTLNDTWSVGTLSIFQKFIYSGNNSSSSFLLTSYADGPWRASVGAGQFQSSHAAAHFSMVFSLQYNAIKSIALFD